jgi:hypothetical protein
VNVVELPGTPPYAGDAVVQAWNGFACGVIAAVSSAIVTAGPSRMDERLARVKHELDFELGRVRFEEAVGGGP